MSVNRKSALEAFLSRPQLTKDKPQKKISGYFSENVFTKEKMRDYLTKSAFREYEEALLEHKKIERALADEIAAALKSWAIDKGTTHYTHWFQPLTGATAEKHDSFFEPTEDGKGIEKFDGGALSQQEPDASSFPTGGLRATFEARGYTAWDPSSPAFIMEIGGGKTLCIPTVFIAYTGEALDYKTPLLKSVEVLDKAATEVVKYFDRYAKHTLPTLGWEQEYFVIDKAMYYARPDLVANGRTVFGRGPAKGQQLDDHYFGSIPERVYHFMIDLETESHKLGIPIRTRHNEVAPSQFEFAPMFEEVNTAVDHNQLFMDLLDRISRRHELIVLTHEKPFAGVNGSGKHNNWSLSTDSGKNLLSPGHTPRTNLQFLTFFVNVIKAVHDHDDLLRASIGSESNEYRLGANEAPPAIISVFIGSYLTKVLDAVEKRAQDKMDEMDEQTLKLDINKMIPDVMLDNTDRNRTSPFAFTGNKFEFRAVGSSANCADPMTVLNTIVANQLNEFKEKVDKHIDKGEKKDIAILKEIRTCIKASKKILFEGDNYSEDWEKEAKKRGLKNEKNTPIALDAYISKGSKKLFTDNEIFTERELDARHEIILENYIMKVGIESKMIEEIAVNQIIPAALKYQTTVFQNLTAGKNAGMSDEELSLAKRIATRISNCLSEIRAGVVKMREARDKADKKKTARDQAASYCADVKGLFPVIREQVDELELLVDDANWPLPKYREILFAR